VELVTHLQLVACVEPASIASLATAAASITVALIQRGRDRHLRRTGRRRTRWTDFTRVGRQRSGEEPPH
jgi:hypothetical protein